MQQRNQKIENIHAKLQKDLTTTITQLSPISKDVGNLIVEYSTPDYEQVLNPKELAEAKQRTTMIDSHATGNGQYFKSCFEKAWTGRLYRLPIIFLPFIPLTIAGVKTLARKHPYNWDEISLHLSLLNQMTYDDTQVFARKCIDLYLQKRYCATEDTFKCLFFDLRDDLISPSKLIKAIEDFLKNPANSSSSLYGIFVGQLHEFASDIQDKLDSAIIEKSKQQKSCTFFKTAGEDNAAIPNKRHCDSEQSLAMTSNRSAARNDIKLK